MPHALLQLPDVYESVIRRVSVAVAADLARIMHLPESTAVYLPGNVESTPMNNGVFGNCCNSNVTYPSDARLVVRYQEEANDNVTLTTGVNNTENAPIWRDEVHDVTIRPVWRYVNFTLTLEYTSPNITVAQRWLDEQRARISMGRNEQYTQVEYHWTLPKPLLNLYRILYDTMQASEFPSEQTFAEYVQGNFLVPITSVSTLSGGDLQISVLEKQMDVIGWFDFDSSPPTPERDANGTGTYLATISYTFRYNRPTHVFCRFPFLMNQNPIPIELRQRSPVDNYKNHARRVSKTKLAFDTFLAGQHVNKLGYIHYPIGDEWIPAYVPKGRLTFFQGLAQISKADLTSVVDLSDMGTLKYTPWFLEYFYHQGDKLFTPGSSIFEFRLYENNDYKAGHPLEFIPGTTTIRSKVDLNPEKFYHVQMSLVRNWYELNPNTYQCLRRYPTVLFNALKGLGALKDVNSPAELGFLAQGSARPPSDACPGEGTVLCSGQYPALKWSEPGDSVCPLVIRTGIVKQSVIDKALDQLDSLQGSLVDRNKIGPLNVMYLDILTFAN